MAINKFELCNSQSLLNGKDDSSCHLIEIDYSPNEIISNATKRGKFRKSTQSAFTDRLQLLSRVTERKIVHRDPKDYTSSFPLAANIYKASSDEFRALKRNNNKKTRKSVLTLPNEPAPMPQVCTVSDVNDTDYVNDTCLERSPIVKKRTGQTRKMRVRNDNYEFYDRDARHCSQMNIDLDCSSTDMIGHYKGDGTLCSNKKGKGQKSIAGKEEEFQGHDVWAVLRNINRFQFRPSPRISEESIVVTKKRRPNNKRRMGRKERRVIETCHTEEIAYIANFQVSRSQSSVSQTSSIDRVTVINNDDCFPKDMICRPMCPNKALKEFKGRANIKFRNVLPNRIVPQITMKSKPKGTQNNKLKESSSASQKGSLDSSSAYLRIMEGSEKNFKKSKDTKKHYVPEYRDSTCNTIKFAQDVEKSYNSSQSNKNQMEVANVQSTKNQTEVAKVQFIKNQLEVAKVPSIKNQLDVAKAPSSNPQPSRQNSPIIKSMNDRKQRLVTTMPSGAFFPKLTTTDIKRRLAHIKFPITILGKDQLSSGIEVQEDYYSQFDGLNKHVWPFMVEWSPSQIPIKEKRNLNHQRKVNNEINKYNSIANKYKDRKVLSVAITNSTANNKKKSEQCRPQCTEKHAPVQHQKKPKAVRQFNDKMLKLLYKKSKDNFCDAELSSDHGRDVKFEQSSPNRSATKVNKVDAGTETYMYTDYLVKQEQKLKTRQVQFNRPKPKWASDFIENVITKINNGSYYSHDINHCYLHNRKYDHKDRKEVSTQAGVLTKLEILLNQPTKEEDITISSFDTFPPIPGFDDALPALEVESLNVNKIAVKHCMANFMIQFDVGTPDNPFIALGLKQSLTCFPTDVSGLAPIADSSALVPSIILKCKATLVNAMLPAELCTLIPQIMRKLIDSDGKLTCCMKEKVFLPTISEIIPNQALPMVLPFILSPELIKYRNGRYSGIDFMGPSKRSIYLKIKHKFDVNNLSITGAILITVPIRLFVSFESNPYNFLLPRALLPVPHPQIQPVKPPVNTCSALVPYTPVGPLYSVSDSFSTIMQKVLTFCNFDSFATPANLLCDIKNSCILMTTPAIVRSECKALVPYVPPPKKIVTLTFSKLKIDSLFNGFNKSDQEDHSSDGRRQAKDNVIKKSNIRIPTANKSKRKYVKLYRKCKSTSNISGEKSSTSLNKICNVDDFFQALGTGKTLCSVYDGAGATNLLSSVTEMKSWITDITPRQALLVLLLINKKQTPNLSRFRPILLQGIAVNRITRASELDMEIEVIETENIKLSQYEGISYLPSAVVNRDNLLEELYWIAKTTASDYQKPFDESSEKLLKSLLEKRKKLNPSYLRVMARYVGLGLLKPPSKN